MVDVTSDGLRDGVQDGLAHRHKPDTVVNNADLTILSTVQGLQLFVDLPTDHAVSDAARTLCQQTWQCAFSKFNRMTPA